MNKKVKNQKRLPYESPLFQVQTIEHENCIAAGSLPKEETSFDFKHQYEEERTQDLDLAW